MPDRELVMSSSSEPPGKDPLQNLLEDTETELRRRLEEACEAEAKGVSTESTEEIRRLEDTLLAAAAAANQTIRVRRHMRGRRPSERERSIKIDEAADRAMRADAPVAGRPGESGPADQTRKPDLGVREFIDDKGRPWRAWPVIPGQTRASASGRQFLGDFQDGWICFEGLGSSARRRLPYHRQSNWGSVTDRDLQRLLDQAIDAPVRTKKPQD
jgi:hypothetical protein